jgi:hypothetical protein
MTSFSTEQTLPFTFKVMDGRGRVVDVDETKSAPVAASSDETIATVGALTKNADKTWSGVITSVSPSPEGSTQRVTVDADADLGEGVQDVVGFLDFTVTLDPRSAARIAEMAGGDPVDKAV